MTELLQFLVVGVLIGGVYALLASGLGLIYGVLNVINFAQADFMMLGMFVAFGVSSGLGVDPYLAIPVAFVGFLWLGMLLHRVLISRVMGKRENHEAQVILTLGIALVLQNAMLLAFSATPRLVVGGATAGGFHVGPVFLSTPRVLAFLLAVVVGIGLFVFMQRTRSGRAIRGTAENWEAATYMGVDVNSMYRIAFGIGIALTAIGGIALATFQPLDPFVGLDYIVVMFAAVVLGGLGSVGGAFAGGLVIGIVQSVSQIWTSASLSNVWVFVIFVLILLFRPQGLFGTAQRVV